MTADRQASGGAATETAKAFGAQNRAKLLREWFGSRDLEPENASDHVYRLLLWIDRTTGLAHCYESDKSQPGRPWYARSLAFHVWVADYLRVEPMALGGEIDWLFRRAIEDLSAQLRKKVAEKAAAQRAPYQHLVLPEPGEDAELEDLILTELRPWLSTHPPAEVLRSLTAKVRAHVSVENKRKNLVGEGFEDVLMAVIERSVGGSVSAKARVPLHELPGFHPPRLGEKAKKVDLGILRSDGRRVLVSAKWSIRADREEQFATDFEAYSRLESSNEPFDYVLVTNEFDPARLARACERRIANAALFAHVVHVNPAGLAAAYGTDASGTMQRVLRYTDRDRLVSLEAWLNHLKVQS